MSWMGDCAARTGPAIKALRDDGRQHLPRPSFVHPAMGYRSHRPHPFQRAGRARTPRSPRVLIIEETAC
jgi:hypothetical protein